VVIDKCTTNLTLNSTRNFNSRSTDKNRVFTCYSLPLIRRPAPPQIGCFHGRNYRNNFVHFALNWHYIYLNKMKLILLSLIIIQITGCATLRLSTNASPTNTSSTPKRINRLFWGSINNKVRIADPIYLNNGIQSVSFCMKTPDVIFSVLTLGIYCPVRYSYVLATPPIPNATHHISKIAPTGRRRIYDSMASGCHDIKFYSNCFTHDTVFHKPVLLKRFFWGYINSFNQNWKIPNGSDKGGVQSIDIRVNFWEGIVTFFTAGIYCPVTYTYKFAYLEDEY
jgi:hypothetical protein